MNDKQMNLIHRGFTQLQKAYMRYLSDPTNPKLIKKVEWLRHLRAVLMSDKMPDWPQTSYKARLKVYIHCFPLADDRYWRNKC